MLLLIVVVPPGWEIRGAAGLIALWGGLFAMSAVAGYFVRAWPVIAVPWALAASVAVYIKLSGGGAAELVGLGLLSVALIEACGLGMGLAAARLRHKRTSRA